MNEWLLKIVFLSSAHYNALTSPNQDEIVCLRLLTFSGLLFMLVY